LQVLPHAGHFSFLFYRMTRDKIVFTVQGKLQELLLREDKLSLDKAIQICRAYEQSNKHVKELRAHNSQLLLFALLCLSLRRRSPSDKLQPAVPIFYNFQKHFLLLH
jgi:hypothetical protein